jgi:hypothetical protein
MSVEFNLRLLPSMASRSTAGAFASAGATGYSTATASIDGASGDSTATASIDAAVQIEGLQEGEKACPIESTKEKDGKLVVTAEAD